MGEPAADSTAADKAQRSSAELADEATAPRAGAANGAALPASADKLLEGAWHMQHIPSVPVNLLVRNP